MITHTGVGSVFVKRKQRTQSTRRKIQVYPSYGVPKIWGRMSIKVTDYDFIVIVVVVVSQHQQMNKKGSLITTVLRVNLL